MGQILQNLCNISELIRHGVNNEVFKKNPTTHRYEENPLQNSCLRDIDYNKNKLNRGQQQVPLDNT